MNKFQQEIIENFISSADELNTLIRKLPSRCLDWAEKEGEWTIRQILHHLADDCNVYIFVIERALVKSDCKVYFAGFPGNEAWANGLDFDQRPVTHVLNLIRDQRAFLAELVSHFSDRWENKAGFYNESNEKVAEMTTQKIIDMLTEHMREHTLMINRIIKTNQAKSH